MKKILFQNNFCEQTNCAFFTNCMKNAQFFVQDGKKFPQMFFDIDDSTAYCKDFLDNKVDSAVP